MKIQPSHRQEAETDHRVGASSWRHPELSNTCLRAASGHSEQDIADALRVGGIIPAKEAFIAHHSLEPTIHSDPPTRIAAEIPTPLYPIPVLGGHHHMIRGCLPSYHYQSHLPSLEHHHIKTFWPERPMLPTGHLPLAGHGSPPIVTFYA